MPLLFSSFFCLNLAASQRTEVLLEKNWKFTRGDPKNAESVDFDDSTWKTVRIPHDWAIDGPFDHNTDMQDLAIEANLEVQHSMKTGRTGGLPYIGVGWYRTNFKCDVSKNTTLVFDGAMSDAHVYLNGKLVCNWPYGYNTFYCDITNHINKDGSNNLLAVRLENLHQSSRWYPGAGLYRNVHLIQFAKTHLQIWGNTITTPSIKSDTADVTIKSKVYHDDKMPTASIKIVDPKGQQVEITPNIQYKDMNENLREFEFNFTVKNPQLWSPDTPNIYLMQISIAIDNDTVDYYEETFGIRKIEFKPKTGFYLNDVNMKFNGVCIHHDLGPLGSIVNKKGIRHELEMLKDMGTNAIRTTHNMPAPELVELCDELGLMMMVESFDEWDIAKCLNGYHRYWDEWAEKDIINMIQHYKNHPSIIMWSVGNEIPKLCTAREVKVLKQLVEWCHREDPTRKVTCGVNQPDCSIPSGFSAALDIPGFNYHPWMYKDLIGNLTQGFLLGTETGSTISSRGIYKLPVIKTVFANYPDHQLSGYDVEVTTWSNIPEIDFINVDDNEWCMGQFVWTGIDYLGEPTPYDTEGWPSHSSYFGCIDLALIPKDRYYIFRSHWNKKDHTLHMLPHWNWEGREGDVVPVMVYSDHPYVELFINDVSWGKLSKSKASNHSRYRFCWMNAVYQPGKIKAVAYDINNNKVGEVQINTAGKPHHIVMETKHQKLAADGKDLAYITVSIVDADGNFCPNDNREVSFIVKGKGHFKAVANGDAASVEPFQRPRMHLFAGKLTCIVESEEEPGEIVVEARAKGVEKGIITITSV